MTSDFYDRFRILFDDTQGIIGESRLNNLPPMYFSQPRAVSNLQPSYSLNRNLEYLQHQYNNPSPPIFKSKSSYQLPRNEELKYHRKIEPIYQSPSSNYKLPEIRTAGRKSTIEVKNRRILTKKRQSNPYMFIQHDHTVEEKQP